MDNYKFYSKSKQVQFVIVCKAKYLKVEIGKAWESLQR